MGFFENFSLWGGGFPGSLLPFLFVLTIVVFFHELGHFLVARLCGVRVMVFSVGFGPEIVGFNDRHGTRWKISAIPLGGYVKFFGDEDVASTPDHASVVDDDGGRAARELPPSERRQACGHRRGRADCQFHSRDPDLCRRSSCSTASPRRRRASMAIQPDSAAAAAGFQAGDVVVGIDGRPIKTFAEMQRVVSTNAGQELAVTVERGGAQARAEGDARRCAK